MHVPARVVSVRKFSHRLIDLMSHRLYNGITVVGGRLSFPSFPLFLGFK